MFDQKLEIGNVPDSVTHLKLGGLFNKELEIGHIPYGVTHLKFNDRFDQKLQEGHIPNSVTHLSFGRYFSQILEADHIPTNLESITCRSHNTPIDLRNVPLCVRIYLRPGSDETITLSNIRHKVHIIGEKYRDKQIISGEMEGVHYIKTIEENGKEYLVVHGDDYVPYTRAKSARK